jgi:TPR repeat protein
MYATGKGAPLDYVEADKWLRLAAAQGHAKALWGVVLLYDNGWGVSTDQAEALRWYRLAAEKGEPQAQTNVGTFMPKVWLLSRISRKPPNGTGSPHVRALPRA